MMASSDDVYRVDNVAAYYDSDSSDDEVVNDAQQQPNNNMKRPPPISTGGFDTSIIDDNDDDEEGEEVVIERHVHFQDPKRSHQTSTTYPVQSLRTTALEHDMVKGYVSSNSSEYNNSKVDATPAFLRRAARDDVNAKEAAARVINPQPPNTLSMLRDNHNNKNNNNNDDANNYYNDASFYGADASALDGTFVSIRDLNEDDDVPSIDNEQWNNSTFDRQSDISSGFPTETTSLLQRQQQQQQRSSKKKKQLPWQGGFFGSQVEKEDKKERRKMNQKRHGWFHGLLGLLRSATQNEINHPTGDDFTPRAHNNNSSNGYYFNNNKSSYYHQRQALLSFSTFLTCALCFHIGLCGIHDLFMRYLSYRNPNNDDGDVVEATTSWNGGGTYIPAFWFSSEGRIYNPLIGPGARTLTAFGALVPGIVISKGQRWRLLTSLLETSSCLQLALQVWILKTVVGNSGSSIGLERSRGTYSVVLLYLGSALVGSAWSMALEPGRLITASEMGTAGLLAGAIMQQLFHSDANKDDDDAMDFGSHRNQQHNNGANNNMMATGSNEQFTFQPPVAPRKKRRVKFNARSPIIAMVLQIFLSWLSAYSSLIGTIGATGAACALLLLVGITPSSSSVDVNNDLSFSESIPPPPPPTRFDDEGWNDDESTDTSVGDGKQFFQTPLMRRSILADDEDEEEPLGSRSSLRKRKMDAASSTATPRGLKERLVRGRSVNAYRVLSRLIGILIGSLLTLIPVVLILSNGGISNEVTRATVLGCKPMRIVYQDDSGEDSFECAGGCVPLSLVRVAQRKESMKAGRCDAIGYSCWQQAGTMTLRNHEVDVGVYVDPAADGTCSNADNAEDNSNYYNADGGEAIADNGNDGEAQQNNAE